MIRYRQSYLFLPYIQNCIAVTRFCNSVDKERDEEAKKKEGRDRHRDPMRDEIIIFFSNS